MRMFAGAVRLDGGPAPLSFRAALRGAPYCKDHALQWVATDGLIAAVGPEHGACPPAISRSGAVTVVGVARLDNRPDILAWLGDVDPSISDLALAGHVALRRGVAGVGRLLGDFAFAVWEADTRTLIAARDTFGVKQLYYANPSPGVVTFSSRAELLAQGDDYNVEYLACWISYCPPDPTSTVYPRVSALPAATVLRFDHGLPRTTCYWNAFDAQARGGAFGTEREQCEAVRELLIEAVRARLTDGPHTWSHLSGGLDSSSVVSIAQWLASKGAVRHGLAGTVSFIDTIGTAADEGVYSDAVVSQYGIRNEKIPHQLDRREILADLPRGDQPADCSYSVAGRDQRVAEIVGREDGSVLLTGIGGDNLFLGTMFFFADWLVSGNVVGVVREMAHRAAVGRVSFWELAYQNAIVPLFPNQVRRHLNRKSDATIPPWVSKDLVIRYGLYGGTGSAPAYDGRWGRIYPHSQAAAVAAIPSTLGDGTVGDRLDVRHPYLYRPLIELSLQLAPEMCVRPHARKWILREAMRDIVPEAVRTRVGKGNGGGLASWSLSHELHLVDSLLDNSVLAQLGIIDTQRLRAAIATTALGGAHEESISARVQSTIDLELWVRARSGRWGSEVTGGQRTGHDKRSTRARHSPTA